MSIGHLPWFFLQPGVSVGYEHYHAIGEDYVFPHNGITVQAHAGVPVFQTDKVASAIGPSVHAGIGFPHYPVTPGPYNLSVSVAGRAYFLFDEVHASSHAYLGNPQLAIEAGRRFNSPYYEDQWFVGVEPGWSFTECGNFPGFKAYFNVSADPTKLRDVEGLLPGILLSTGARFFMP